MYEHPLFVKFKSGVYILWFAEERATILSFNLLETLLLLWSKSLYAVFACTYPSALEVPEFHITNFYSCTVCNHFSP
jgi:hypothetical protein